MQVSETDMRLIGFTSAGERAWFRLLTHVQGVGSKVALAILSALTVEELQRACAQGDPRWWRGPMAWGQSWRRASSMN
jgi:Holliday junction DNA helicase RuvA